MSTSETITRTDLTNILNEVLPSTHGIGITNQSVTVGSSQYDGYYYKDCDITLPSGAVVIAVTSWSTTNNRSAITQRMWQVGDVLTVRVLTKQANTTVDIRVAYVGGG